MEPTDQLDAPDRRLPESRVGRFARRKPASRPSSIFLVNQSFHRLPRSSELAAVGSGDAVWRVAGTMSHAAWSAERLREVLPDRHANASRLTARNGHPRPSRSPSHHAARAPSSCLSVDDLGNSSGPVHAGPPLTLCASSSECATEHPSGERAFDANGSITELPSRWPRLAIRP